MRFIDTTSKQIDRALHMVPVLLGSSFAIACATAYTTTAIAANIQSGAETKSGSTGAAVVSIDRLKDTPDLMQSLPQAKLPRRGYAYCGPVAVSNSLVWLSKNGYPKLAPADGSLPKGQGALVMSLADYFHTTQANGTSPTAMLNGINRYVRDRGYKIKSLQYEGFQQCPKAFAAGHGASTPDLDWIKQGLVGHSAVWLMVGWYKYSAATDTYSSFAQHWVSVVGCGQDKTGKADPNILIIHDPAPRGGAALSHDYVTLQRLTRGRFAKGSGRPKSAAEWYKLGGDLKIKEGADCALLDGAIILQLS